MTRLDSVAPDLAELLRGANDMQLRAVARVVARLAITHSGVQETIAEEALSALERGASATQLSAHLSQLTDRYDAKYLECQAHEQSESALDWFCKARALNAVKFAVESNALEACYESQASTDDLVTLRAKVREATGAI